MKCSLPYLQITNEDNLINRVIVLMRVCLIDNYLYVCKRMSVIEVNSTKRKNLINWINKNDILVLEAALL